MSIQDIAVKIIADAQQQASNIHAAAEKSAQEIAEKSQKNTEEQVQKVSARAEEKIQKAVKKAETLAHMEGKSQVLTMKQEMVASVLQEAVKELSAMSAKDYEQFLATLLEQVDVEDATIYPAKGKENSTKGAVKLAGKNFKVGESRDFLGGVYIESTEADIDLQFDTLVFHMFKKDLEALVANKLFA